MMLKTILLTGTMMIAAPALAQTTAPTGQTAPSTAPSTMQDSAAPTATTPMQDPSATSAAPTTGTGTTGTGTTGQAGATGTASAASAKPTQSQVAQVVDQQFTTYDKDANGALSKAEFAAWMTALKSQSPAAQAGSPAEETAWNDAAFTQADGDKSTTVTKTELTAFLVRGAASSS